MDNKILIFLIALLSSCDLIISQDQDKNGIIAKVGDAYLYDDDIISVSYTHLTLPTILRV